MNPKKYNLRVCLGSACFSRGNQDLTKIISQFIQENKLEEVCDFRGKQCLELCAEGPVLVVNDKVYKEVTDLNINELLKNIFHEELLPVK